MSFRISGAKLLTYFFPSKYFLLHFLAGIVQSIAGASKLFCEKLQEIRKLYVSLPPKKQNQLGTRPIMQKKSFSLMGFVLFMFLGLSACHQEPSHLELDAVDSLCSVQPEKALEMLDNYKHVKSKAPKAVQMRYDLLMTKAQDKGVIPHTSDSVMRQVVEYYADHGNVNEQLESMYYLGSVYRDLHDSPRALTWYLRATEWGEQHINEVDSIILRNVYAQLSSLYDRQYDYAHSLETSKREFQLSADSVTDPRTTMDLASSYMMQELADTGKILYDIALNRIKELDAEIPYSDLIAGQLAQLSGHFRDREMAQERLRILLNHPETHRIYNVASSIASFYETFGPVDSAIYYYRRSYQVVSRINIKSGVAGRLATLFNSAGLKDSALHYASLYIQLHDSLYRLQKWEDTKLFQNEFQYQRNKEAEAEAFRQAAEERNMRQMVVIVALIVLVMMSALLLWREKRAKNAIDEKDSEIAASRDMLMEREQQLEQSLVRNEELSSRWEMEQKKTEVVELSDITEALKKVAAGHRVGVTKRELIKELFRSIDAMYPDFEQQLRQQMGQPSKNDLSMAYLSKAGLSQAEIANLMNVHASTVYRHLLKLAKR